MDSETTSQGVSAYVQANAMLEAARITASATVQASRNTLLAAGFAGMAAVSAVIAALINSAPARQAAAGKREAYRHFIDGLIESFIDASTTVRRNARVVESAMIEGRWPFAAGKFHGPEALVVPPDLSANHWETHGIIGADFARYVVVFRAAVANYHIERAKITGGYQLDRVLISSDGEQMHDFDHHDNAVAKMIYAARRLQEFTRTPLERLRVWVRRRKKS